MIYKPVEVGSTLFNTNKYRYTINLDKYRFTMFSAPSHSQDTYTAAPAAFFSSVSVKVGSGGLSGHVSLL